MNQIQQFFEYIFQAFKIWIIIQPWQSGIRVRNGKKQRLLPPGLYFRYPYFDAIFIQENRLRVVSLPIQTLTSKDGQTITLNGAVGYVIKDIQRLYETLYHPEVTISNITMSEVATFINRNNLENIQSDKIKETVLKKLSTLNYGLEFQYFEVINFAVVKTFRLIQDQNWFDSSLQLDQKK